MHITPKAVERPLEGLSKNVMYRFSRPFKVLLNVFKTPLKALCDCDWQDPLTAGPAYFATVTSSELTAIRTPAYLVRHATVANTVQAACCGRSKIIRNTQRFRHAHEASATTKREEVAQIIIKVVCVSVL